MPSSDDPQRQHGGKQSADPPDNPSFTAPTGPCLRCGREDRVAMVRGANLCMRCLKHGVSPRYDQVGDPEGQIKRLDAVRESDALMRNRARASNRRRLAAEVAKAREAAAEAPAPGRVNGKSVGVIGGG